jgi:hypothetical protein
MSLERVIVIDESWFFLSYRPDSAYATSRDWLPKQSNNKIDADKYWISVLWSADKTSGLRNVGKHASVLELALTHHTAW